MRVTFRVDAPGDRGTRRREVPSREGRPGRTRAESPPDGAGMGGGILRGLRARAGAESGYSFVELLVVSAIVLILASAVMPLTRVTMQRQREAELRRALREMRTAIDGYKDAVDLGVIAGPDVDADNEGYPATLEILVEGVEFANDATGRKMRFLRRIPFDPMTQSRDWGLRAYDDEPDSRRWSGDNVYDVYTTSRATALDGTRYDEW